MALVKSIIGIDKTQKYDITQGLVDNVSFSLPNDRLYEMGIDQSSTCTGLYVTDAETSFHLVIEVTRTGEVTRDFYRQLKQVLIKLTEGKRFSMVIIEEPVPSKYRTAGSVLRELKGRLEEWIVEIPAFENALYDCIKPQVWKSKMRDKTKGTGRFNNKQAMAEDISDRFPVLKNFIPFSAKDRDGFEACGVLHGYKKSHYTKDGVKLVKASKEYRHHSIAFFKYLPSTVTSDAETIFKDLDIPRFNLGVEYQAYNIDYSLYNNVRMASSAKDFMFTYITDPLVYMSLLWEFNLDYKEGYVMFMFVLRSTAVTPSSLDYLKSKHYYQIFN